MLIDNELVGIGEKQGVKYQLDFYTTHGQWKIVKGEGDYTIQDHNLCLNANEAEVMVIDEAAPLLQNGEIEFELETSNDTMQIGIVFRYDEAECRWVSITAQTKEEAIYTTRWEVQTHTGTKQEVDKDNGLIYSGKRYTVKLTYIEDVVTIYLDHMEVFHTHVENMPLHQGKIGFYAANGTCQIHQVTYTTNHKLIPTSGQRETLDISSEQLTVTLDKNFPAVIGYEMNKKKLKGQEISYDYVQINGTNYKAKGKVSKKDGTEVVYAVTVVEAGVRFDTRFKVDKNLLKMFIENIQESDQWVYTIGFPKHNLIAVTSTEKQAAFDASYMDIDLGLAGEPRDIHINVKEGEVQSAYHYCNIPILTNEALAATMYNNVIHNYNEFVYQMTDNELHKTLGVWNSPFTYRGLDGEIIANPECVVVLTEECNGDGQVDWQDGAVALKKARPVLPGVNKLRNSYVHIAMNFASGAQHPFLRILDNLKVFSHCIDGFEQMLIIKGFQSEGHDSGHIDVETISHRAGGVQDFNVLIDEAKKLGIDVGVHINHLEAYPEAKAYDEEIVTTLKGWVWLDQSYVIKREKDILNGGLEARLDKLKALAPNLGPIYVDTYRDERWNAYKLATKLHEITSAIFTEDTGKLDRYAIWTHYTAEKNSNISRFVNYEQKDIYAGHPLLKNAYERYGDNGFMGWQNESNIHAAVRAFYTKQLPYRYLMNHTLTKLTDQEARFEEGIMCKKEGEHINLYERDRLIASDTLIFIPWRKQEEEKIYHWNPKGGKTEWTLPEGWENLEKIIVYRNSPDGKVKESEVVVVDGKVVIDTQANTPYVIYKKEGISPKMTWSTGSIIQDTGFNSQNFSSWHKIQSNEYVNMKRAQNGYAYLEVYGKTLNGVKQMINLEPCKKYELSVWAEVEQGRARLAVTIQEGEVLGENYMEHSLVIQQLSNSNKKDTKYFRVSTIFRVPQDIRQATIYLMGEGKDKHSYVRFMDVRIVETTRPDLTEGVVVYEDFENVTEGYGPFVAKNYTERTHLSQAHEGYTTDTIEGNWSLKTFDADLRTMPHTVRLEANTSYRIVFEGIGNGRVKVISDETQNKVLDAPINQEGTTDYQFTTGHEQDYAIHIDREGTFTIDNFKVCRI